MKFEGLKQIEKGTHICRYNLYYETEDNRHKTYEIVSRDPDIKTQEDLSSWRSSTVTLIGISEDENSILLNHEFRMAVGDWVYNFPSGLIDSGETPHEAAARELQEETGLTIVRRIVRLKSSFNSVGLSNESSSCEIAIVSGKIHKSSSSFEEIRAAWYTKNEVKNLVKTSKMSARTQLFCLLWAYGGLSINNLTEELNKYENGHLW